MPVIIGTAGHIDHGKTTLIRTLTGIDCDRLSEEKKRGITIELGFAYLDLPDGRRIGVVDVPGHERFVKNMVAGAAGIDFVVLVIAADEGVMPQTREHLEICTLLGTTTGLVVLTKTDMVDEEWLELVGEDVREFLSGTFLEDAPMVPVSSQTGEGMDRLKAELSAILDAYQEKRRSDLFRLPIDRVFTMKGYGTVITGTLVSGKVKVGEDVRAFPSERTAKVRGLQSHGASAESVSAGQRTAMNLQGVEVEELSRGMMLGAPGTLFPGTLWDVELTLLASCPRALKHRKEVHFHHGSREILARVYFMDRDKLDPGETALCQVRFPEPMTGVYGDRVVLRSFSPLRTIGGGKLLNPLGRKVKRFSEEVGRVAELSGLEGEALVLRQLALAGPKGLTFAQLMILTDLESKALDKLLAGLGGQQKALIYDKESRTYVSGEVVEELSRSLLEYLEKFHKDQPMKQGLGRGQLASHWGRKLPAKLVHFLVERLVKQDKLASEQETLRLPGHKVSMASDAEKLSREIMAAYEKGGIAPPNLKDVLDPLGVTAKEAAPVFRLLAEQGRLIKVKEEMFFTAGAYEKIKELVVGYFEKSDDLGPGEFRELTGLSRKYTIPLLEYLDKDKFTVRVGDKRQLRRR